MKDIHTLEEYEIRILEILGSEDITTHFDEMLAIGARIINGMISGSDKKLLASRIKTQIYFASDDGLNDALRHVAYLHLMVLLDGDSQSYERLLQFIAELDIETKYVLFLLTQAGHMAYLNPTIYTAKAHYLYRKIFKKIVLGYKKDIQINYTKIPKEKRNKKNVIVLTQQYLTLGHEPTKRCNQMADVLMNDMEKNVMIINTNDLLPVGHMVPLFGIQGQNSLQFMETMNYTHYNGKYIPYFQCGKKMPDLNEIMVVLNTIREMSPEYIITMNRYSLVGALASYLVPIMNVDELGDPDHDKMMDNILKYQDMVREGFIYKVKISKTL